MRPWVHMAVQFQNPFNALTSRAEIQQTNIRNILYTTYYPSQKKTPNSSYIKKVERILI